MYHYYVITMNSLPNKTMKAAIATGFGDIDEHIHVKTDWPVPADEPRKNELLIRVLACALAPGDVRVLSGKCDWIQLPKSGHPYVVGGDVSGIVVACGKDDGEKFQPGDYVVSRFELPGPHGGMAQYRIVKTKLTEKCPASIPPIESCGLTASAMAAKKIVMSYVKKGDRVLVLGGSGGVGSSVLQYAKLQQAGLIVAVSTMVDLCRSLGADRVIDYRREEQPTWWEIEDFQQEPFDVVFDMVGGDNWEKGGCCSSKKAVNSKGTYVALPSGVQTDIELHGWFDLIAISLEWMSRTLSSRLNPSIPKWVAPTDALDLNDGDLRELLEDVVEGRLRPVLDPSSPFEFTETGVRNAFHLQKSCHAHGKVVVKVADH